MFSIVSFESQRVKSLAREVHFLEEVLRQSSETLKLKQTTAAMFVHHRLRSLTLARLGDRAQAVGFDLERDVYEIVIIFERIYPCYLCDLPIAKVLAELLECRVGDSFVPRSFFHVGKCCAFSIRKQRTGSIFRESIDLLHPEALANYPSLVLSPCRSHTR
jgi:hypothetical protein